MRTIHRLELLENISKNPYSFIGQRNFNLLYCFLHGNFEKVVNTNLISKSNFNEAPSFREFIEIKTSRILNESIHWKWALGFDVEDQRELFHKYFNFLSEYEDTYPFDYSQLTNEDGDENEDNNKDTDEFSIIENIKAISQRPAMFSIFGVSDLRAYIDGEIYNKKIKNKSFTNVESKIIHVINFYKSKINIDNTYETWDRVLMREELNINEFTIDNFPNSWAMTRFIEVLEEKSTCKLKNWRE